ELDRIASRIVDQQLAAEPAPGAVDVTMPERGQVLTFTRTMQVDGDAPLKLDLRLGSLPRSNSGFLTLVILAIAAIAMLAMPRSVED
ncbi:MAG: hypothetical protein ABSE62_06040, partial [Chthoniobacteraceae bacterium]